LLPKVLSRLVDIQVCIGRFCVSLAVVKPVNYVSFGKVVKAISY